MNKTSDLKKLLTQSARTHGHLCPGQVLGVRMSMLGLAHIGITDPKGRHRKNLMTFVEIDRCATDAIQSVTGCTIGRRTLKFLDYGKMAATFLNLGTGKAVRVLARESREKASEYFPAISNKYEAQLQAYKIMPDEELFLVSEVVIKLRPEDKPGKPVHKNECRICRELVHLRESITGDFACRACTEGGYFRQA